MNDDDIKDPFLKEKEGAEDDADAEVDLGEDDDVLGEEILDAEEEEDEAPLWEEEE
ncbi:MAG: hypothetical protein WCV55_02730 [Candidatus Paceibacterota bacterium]